MASDLPPRGIDVVGIDDLPPSEIYPREVIVRLQADARCSYREAARSLNESGAEVVYLQHEFGIFGGAAGSYVLDLVAALDAPLVTTLHTVRASPTDGQREVMEALLDASSQVVVMNPTSVDCLERHHGALGGLVNLIPHGVPDLPLIEPEHAKADLGLEGRRLLLTFGLLSRDKGIEVVLEALPTVLERHPDLLYIVLGATHPSILRWEGEAYRQSLEQQVDQLGLGPHVAFENIFADMPTLWRYLAAADVYVSPNRNPEQEVSGTLVFALSAGNAVVATPYPGARELITQDLGCLFPFGAPAALASALIDLLDDPSRTARMRRAGYQRTRALTWPVLGRRYLELAQRAVQARAAPDRARGV
jgi:glycosyltransferase involved in cell wall biosynthesis